MSVPFTFHSTWLLEYRQGDLLMFRKWREWSLLSRGGIGRYSTPQDWTSFHLDMLLSNSYVLSPLLLSSQRILMQNSSRSNTTRMISTRTPLTLMTAFDPQRPRSMIYEFTPVHLIAIICWHIFLFHSIFACIKISFTHFSHLTAPTPILFHSLGPFDLTRRCQPRLAIGLVGLLCPHGPSLSFSHDLCPKLEHVTH